MDNKEFSVFTYEVCMLVNVFAENESEARRKLDDNGGFVSMRDVELKEKQNLYSKE